jgi:hypothetical protein
MMDGRFWMGFVASGLVAFGMTEGCATDHETRFYPDPEAGVREASTTDTSVPGRCPSETPLDPKTLEWKPPATLQAGRCKDEDIAATKAYLAAHPAASNEDFENFVKNRDRACHDCIFGDADGALWPPAPVRGGKVVTFNVGACYALVTGSQECGRAFQNAWDCGFEVCAFCTSPDVLNACRAKARTGACVAFDNQARANCGGTNAADEICGAPFDSIREQCMSAVSPIADAGTD